MADARDYAVYLGAVDWRHPEWVGAFYPEDMPEDWRLAYYGTQFRCVYLERDAWSGVAPEVLAGWAGEAHAGFRFVIEPSGEAALDRAAAAAFGAKLGFVGGRDDPRLLWFDTGDDMRGLAAEVRRRADSGRPYLLSRDGDMRRLEEMKTMLELLGL